MEFDAGAGVETRSEASPSGILNWIVFRSRLCDYQIGDISAVSMKFN